MSICSRRYRSKIRSIIFSYSIVSTFKHLYATFSCGFLTDKSYFDILRVFFEGGISNYLFPGAITRTFEIPYHRLALNGELGRNLIKILRLAAVTILLHPPLPPHTHTHASKMHDHIVVTNL